MACGDNKEQVVGQGGEIIEDPNCYPTGCPPCNEEIEFPGNPVDGDRFCVPIGSMGEQKCWIYDKCVPGWRAEGPATSPTRYRGAVDLCSQDAFTDALAGDWIIVAEDCDQPLASWGIITPVTAGERVAYSGSQWQVLDPPAVPFAEAARDGDKPNPDDRNGGIVKLATVGQVEEGTNKCDVVTPYTLKEGIGGIIPKPTHLELQWRDGITERTISIDDKILNFSLAGFATNGGLYADGGIPVSGNWTFKFYDVTDGTPGTELELFTYEEKGGGISYGTWATINFEITPVTAERQIRAVGTFYDIYGNTYTAESVNLKVYYVNAMKITQQPTEIDTQPEDQLNVVQTTSVVVEPYSSELPWDPTQLSYQWFIFDVPIEGANDPDLDYTFAGWDTDTLSVTRTAISTDTVQTRCEVRYGDDHPVYEGVIDQNGNVIILEVADNFAKAKVGQIRAHHKEVTKDWLDSDSALIKGPAGTIIKEITKETIIREIQAPFSYSPGSQVRTGGSQPVFTGTGIQLNSVIGQRLLAAGRASFGARASGGGYRGKGARSDRRLKKNIKLLSTL